MHKISCLCLLTLLGLGIFGNFTPQVNAPLSGTNFYEELTGLPFHPRVVNVDSKGNIFVLSYDQDIWRSTDNGISWTKVFDDGLGWSGVSPAVRRNFLTLFVDSNGYVFANIARTKTGGIWDLYRSVDGGSSWSIVVADNRRSWHMDEASNGTLWFHTYTGPGWATIHKSVDHGATWSVFNNFTMVSEDLRTVAVNDYDDNEIWAATSRRVWYWNGSSWVTIHSAAEENPLHPYNLISSIWFDSKYAYLGSETRTRIFRFTHAPTPISIADYDYYWDADKLTYLPDEHSFQGLRIDDIMLFGTRSQLWGSCDGNRWVKIVDLGNGTASDIASISQRRPIHFVDKKVGKLYRLSITKEDLIQLYYAEFLKRHGNLVNQENYVAEYRIVNGTNEVDLTNVALTNVQASIKGLSRKNYYNNSGWETGTTAGWSIPFGQGSYSVVSTDNYEGTYALKITKSVADTYDRSIWQSYIPASRGTILTFSAWIKANVTLTNKVRLGFRNQTSGTFAYYPGSARGVKDFNVTTSWTRVKLYFALNNPDVNLRAEFSALKSETYELFVDGLQLEKREVEIIRQEPNTNTESIEHLQYQPSPYFADTLDTLNPSVTIAGQSVSYSGTLTNGTASSLTNITGILTGAVQVEANIRGSEQAILRITGTRIVSLTNAVLKQRTSDGIYVGRYYATPTMTTNVTDFIALTNKEANITSASYVPNKLTLTINSLSGTTSTTLIYVGDKGEPTSVSGATTWSYNNETKTVTTNILHTSPQEVVLNWTEHNPPTTTIHLSGVQGNKGWFTSNVIVTLSATDDISGVNKTEYSFDNATWTTYTTPFTVNTEGYTILYYKSTDKDGNQEKTKTETIMLDTMQPTANAGANQTVNENTLVTFDGSASQDENGIASYTWTFTDITIQTLSGKNPTYTFDTPGVYTITLNVTDAAGNWATDTVVITVLCVRTAFPMWAVAVIVIAIGAVLAVTVFIRRRK